MPAAADTIAVRTTRTRTSLRRSGGAWSWLLGIAALALGGAIALRASSLGDYPSDAGPAIGALLHLRFGSFLDATPAMGLFSLLARWPFAALAYLGKANPVAIYRWGALPCVESVALAALWLAGIARSRGTGRFGQAAIVAVALLNPVVGSALYWGHPEELLTASLAIAAVVAAHERRVGLTILMLGLAMASKQWAALVLFPVFAVSGTGRWRVLGGSVAVAAVLTLPELLGGLHSFVHSQLGLATGLVRIPGSESWPYLLSSSATIQLRDGFHYTGPYMSHTAVALWHPLMFAVAVAASVWLARRAAVPRTADALFGSVALIFLMRAALDPGDAEYSLAPMLRTGVAWDALRGARAPVRSLLGALLAEAVFGRFSWSSIGPVAANAAFDVVTLVACVALVASIAGVRGTRPVAESTVAVGPAGPAAA